MLTKFSILRDINGSVAFGLEPSNNNQSANLTQNVAASVTVPSASSLGGLGYTGTEGNKIVAVIQYGAGVDVWCAVNATAAVPAGATFASTTSMLCPSVLLLDAADVLSFITPDTTANVSVRFYSLN